MRFRTREVMVGNVGVGGNNPIRIQSMTTSNTRDVEATVNQAIRLADAGCEIVRVTVQGIKEADACEAIKNTLIQKGYSTPLVADIHFYPPAAMRVIDFVDKVRINPGNFVDKRASFKTIEYDDASYALEIEKIEEKFTPLVEKCKLLKKSMRIGTNHGSLSDRILNRFGDTPRGMLESAFEFARVCRKNNFHDFMFSMKSSNPKVMIQAYRLLIEEMKTLGWDYPLHLGVTEAGHGEDGRIKSAMGIGSLLLEGIGDTIRVSLTEDPWHEIDACKRLTQLKPQEIPFSLIQKRNVNFPKNLPLHRDGSVCLKYDEKQSPEGVDLLLKNPITLKEARFSLIKEHAIVRVDSPDNWDYLKKLQPDLIILDRFPENRSFFEWLEKEKISTPVILHFTYDCSKEDLVIRAAAELGSLLCDGLGNGIWIEGPYEYDFLKNLSFNILQAARMRTFKTDFISCPSCGRTLFDLQDVSARIRARTAHLPGVKIAIMGCIVNGPGEMADADFGYVGSKPGMIDLYVGKNCVEKDITFAEADDRLVDLIKKHNRWVEI